MRHFHYLLFIIILSFLYISDNVILFYSVSLLLANNYADAIIHSRRISQSEYSETCAITIGDVVNTYIIRCSMRWMEAMEMSLHQYFRLLLDHRDIFIYPDEQTTSCVRMLPNYFVVVLLPNRKIHRFARPT